MATDRVREMMVNTNSNSSSNLIDTSEEKSDYLSDSDTESLTSNHKAEDFKYIIKSILKSVFGVELVAAVFSLAWGIITVINTNLVIDKVCTNTYNFSKDICENLSSENNSLAENQVQKEVTKLNLYGTMMSCIPVMIIAFIIGPLSDRYGRKVALIPPLIGFIVADMIVLVNVIFWTLPAEFTLLAYLYSLFGGFTTFNVGMYAYIGDTTSESSRTTRYSWLDASVFAAMSIGTYISAPIFALWGYKGIYLISMALFTLDIVLVVFCLEGTINFNHRESFDESSEIHLSPISTVRSVFEEREGFNRSIIGIVLLAMIGFAAIVITDFDYIFTRKVLGWNEQTFCKATSLSTILRCFSSVFVLPLLSYVCQIQDSFIGMLAAQSLFGAQILTALTRTDLMFVMAILWGSLSSMFGAACKSTLSKIVTKEEMGKIYSLYGGLENAIPLFIAPIMTWIYNSSVDTLPSLVYYIKAIMSALLIISFLIVSRLQKKAIVTPVISERTPLLHLL